MSAQGNGRQVQKNKSRLLMGTPKTKSSRRALPMPEALKDELKHLSEKSESEEHLIFHTRNGTPFSDTNLLHKHLKPAGTKLGVPWLNWHTLRRTHATLLQHAGATLKEAQAQLGHTKMSTTLEIYTISIPAAQWKAVENLSDLVPMVTSWPNSEKSCRSRQSGFNEINGRHEETRAPDLYRVKVAGSGLTITYMVAGDC
jgi:integrase